MVCNFLGDQWFMESLAADLRMTYVGSRQPWNFTLPDPNARYSPDSSVLF
jgi:hypothetical protein